MDIEDLVAELRRLDIESVSVDREMRPVMAGGTGPFDPPYEEGPDRRMVPSGRITITIEATQT